MNSFETNAFHLLAQRFKRWQQRHTNMCQNRKSIANLLGTFRSLVAGDSALLSKCAFLPCLPFLIFNLYQSDIAFLLESRFDSLPIDDKAELTDVFLDGFLIECDSDEQQELRSLFYLINKVSEKYLLIISRI